MRWWRRVGQTLLALAALFGIGVLLHWPVAYPFDVLMNLGGSVEAPELAAPNDGTVRVVVLQHGLFRTSASLGRLQRCLERHGYEVLNPGYPSTAASIASHAERLAAAIAARRGLGPVDEWHFVAHSMGGVVIQDYLRRPDHVEPTTCVYVGTPHRGAVLAELRRHWFLFRWAMGTTAACELAPSDPRHGLPIPYAERSGALVGDVGAGNPDIPGNDDGTVGVVEATLLGARAVSHLPHSHTALTTAAATQRAVLQFLRHRTFPGAVLPEPRLGR
jgi:triacylglycerol lipase